MQSGNDCLKVSFKFDFVVIQQTMVVLNDDNMDVKFVC